MFHSISFTITTDKNKADLVDNDEDRLLYDENSGDADKDVANLLGEDDADEGIDDTDIPNEDHESGSKGEDNGEEKTLEENKYLTSNEIKEIRRRDSNEIDEELIKETRGEEKMTSFFAKSEEDGSTRESLGKGKDDEAVKGDTNEKQSSGDVEDIGGDDDQGNIFFVIFFLV